MKRAICAVFAFAILVGGCSKEERETYARLNEASRKLSPEFAPGTVMLGVVNDRHLGITITNSPQNAADEQTRSASARKAAQLAVAMIPHIDDVRVMFMERTRAGITITSSVASYRYKASDLTATAAPTRPGSRG